MIRILAAFVMIFSFQQSARAGVPGFELGVTAGVTYPNGIYEGQELTLGYPVAGLALRLPLFGMFSLKIESEFQRWSTASQTLAGFTLDQADYDYITGIGKVLWNLGPFYAALGGGMRYLMSDPVGATAETEGVLVGGIGFGISRFAIEADVQTDVSFERMGNLPLVIRLEYQIL